MNATTATHVYTNVLVSRWPGSNWRSSTARSTAAFQLYGWRLTSSRSLSRTRRSSTACTNCPSPGEMKGERKA